MTLRPALNNSGHLLDVRPDESVNRYTNGGDLAPCWHCSSPRKRSKQSNRGLCSTCYRRWQSHGFAGDRPPAPDPGGNGYVAAERVGWGDVVRDPWVLADFARMDNPSVPGRTAELCRRFGVTRRTLTRWRVRLAAETAARAEGFTDVEPVAAMVAAQTHDPAPGGAGRVACFRA